MANEQNLVNLKDRTKTEQREIARAGGVASGEARRKKKTLAQIGDMIGALEVKAEKNRNIMLDAGIAEEDLIRDTETIFRINLKAQQGDVKAAEFLAKIRGQFKEQISAEVAEVKPLVDLTKRKKNGTE